MPRFVPHVLSLNRASGQCGLTLIELLVTLLILSILAAAALPYAELTVRRDKEIELRRALREMRTAIDRFHDDWKAGHLSKLGNAVSDDGYPKALQIMVDGVETGNLQGIKRKYLRRVPRDPFADPAVAPAEQWALRGYQDKSDAIFWNGKDVFDVRTASEAAAIDGTYYKDW